MNPSYDQVSNNRSFNTNYIQDPAEMGAACTASLIHEGHRCRYPSKRCEFPRAIKRNGEMHRFCDAHRNKANLNQRRLEARRKREMEDVKNSRRKRRSTSADSENSTDQLNHADCSSYSEPCGSFSAPLHSVLAQDELNFLGELLSQNSLEDTHAESAGTAANLSANSFSI
ncbi:hypothetical protein L917_11383 [Phytophthora nicotianae]|uniref:Uncharacterized protein n=1 Tax=Phytophthora nicotianae TaxID=4792 RepID=W2KX10_PHYNI|nr:hypothetical protein L917_11383 [Phytophthora nicotianae]